MKMTAAQTLPYIVLSLKLVHGLMTTAVTSPRSLRMWRMSREIFGARGEYVATGDVHALPMDEQNLAEGNSCPDDMAFGGRRRLCTSAVRSFGGSMVRLRHDRHGRRRARTNQMSRVLRCARRSKETSAQHSLRQREL